MVPHSKNNFAYNKTVGTQGAPAGHILEDLEPFKLPSWLHKSSGCSAPSSPHPGLISPHFSHFTCSSQLDPLGVLQTLMAFSCLWASAMLCPLPGRNSLPPGPLPTSPHVFALQNQAQAMVSWRPSLAPSHSIRHPSPGPPTRTIVRTEPLITCPYLCGPWAFRGESLCV